MPEEVTPTSQVAETPPTGDTAPDAAKAEAPVAPAEPDWRAAYAGLQRTVNKAHQRNESLLQQNNALAGTVGTLKEDMDALLKQQLPEDEWKNRQAQQMARQAQLAAVQAAQQAQTLINAQTDIFVDTLRAAGIDPNDQNIDWAKDAGTVAEWRERVGASVVARVQRVNEERIKNYESQVKAKTAREVEAEAKALTEQQMKAAGVDKIDTGKGSGTAGFVERVRRMDRNTPEGEAEYQSMRRQVQAGTLKI